MGESLEIKVQHNIELGAQYCQSPVVLWFTGLSGAGKTTSARALEESLRSRGYKTAMLDGDVLRKGLCSDLGFSEEDREENVRRVGEISKLMVDAGLIVLVALISPYHRDRKKVREILGEGKFIEVHVNTPLAVCEKRDVKGLYQKAREGTLSHFTGISAPYQVPPNPEITIDTSELNEQQVVSHLISQLQLFGVIS